MSVRERYRAFREWQRRPYMVAPLSEEAHDCLTCGTHYVGNFCPRCGQSAKIGRYSFKKALLLFIDVWGMGNRGMFRSLRDLILRPGYMIRDYLNGMQMAYFPPFKMLFLLTTFSILLNVYGINIRGEVVNSREHDREELAQALAQTKEEADDPTGKMFAERMAKGVGWYLNAVEKYPSAVTLTYIVFFTVFFYIFFHKSRTIPNLSFPEFLIAMVFSANMLSIYEIVAQFLCIKSDAVNVGLLLTTAIPMKQLSGFSWFRTLLSMITAVLLMAILATIGLVAFIIVSVL